MYHIGFRVDSSINIGTGHVMRCLVLADQFQLQGHRITFFIREYIGNLGDFIQSKGYEVKKLPSGVSQEQDVLETLNRIGELDKKLDVMVVDHYEIDHHWESIMAKSVHYLVVIDDLANRKHYCHFLLDPNFHRNPEDRYRGLVPPFSKLLLGPKYSLLRDEFRFNRTNTKVRGDRLRRILVSMGGTDPDNVTMKVIRALKLLNLEDIFVDVVVGSSNPNKTEIKQAIADEPHFFYHEQVQNMAELMKRADLAVGAGGSTSWERCCMGLPTLVINIAENQQDISESLACVGAIVNLGDAENITVEKIAQSITSYFENPVRLKKMSEIGMNLVDGMGAQRVAEEVQIYKYKSTIVSDANSWMNDYIPSFIPYLQKQGHFVTWVHEVSDIEAGDFAFYLGCGQITPESILQRNRHNLVVHGSALPQGKGWSPLTWQILEGKNEIPMTLFEAVPEVDSGPIYIQETMKFRGDELIDELREEQADCSFRLIQQFLRRYPNILKEGRQQTGSSSYYRRRTPEDSKLDPEKSIIEQFNLLRVVDNDRYPAFFEKDGYRYVIKIEKMKE